MNSDMIREINDRLAMLHDEDLRQELDAMEEEGPDVKDMVAGLSERVEELTRLNIELVDMVTRIYAYMALPMRPKEKKRSLASRMGGALPTELIDPGVSEDAGNLDFSNPGNPMIG